MVKLLVPVFIALHALTIYTVSRAWVFPKEVIQRAAAAATIGATIIASPMVANADNVFVGSYADPNHTNCKRIITMPTPTTALLYGTDGNPGCPVDGSGNSWELTGTVEGSTILVDFSPKGGPKGLKGVFDETGTAGIKWPDGNKWTLLSTSK